MEFEAICCLSLWWELLASPFFLSSLVLLALLNGELAYEYMWEDVPSSKSYTPPPLWLWRWLSSIEERNISREDLKAEYLSNGSGVSFGTMTISGLTGVYSASSNIILELSSFSSISSRSWWVFRIESLREGLSKDVDLLTTECLFFLNTLSL